MRSKTLKALRLELLTRRPALHAMTRLLLVLVACLVLVALASTVNAETTYSVVVTIQGLPSTMTTHVYVDGVANGTLSGGQTRSFIFSSSSMTHIITVDFYVPNSAGANGTRYYDKDTSWSFNAAGSHPFTYTTQYYLAVETAYSSAGGEGWYDSGSTAQATVKEAEVQEGQGIRHAFRGWAGDASGSVLNSNILMNGPKRAVAIWKTQFYLTIESDPPSVSSLRGSGWYDAGSKADFSVPVVVTANADSRLRFNHWSGAYAGQVPSGNVLMDRPKVVKAHYIAQYLLTVQYDPASISSSFNETRAGWYDANANVQLGPAPPSIDLSLVERLQFVAWISEGATSSDVPITIFMDKPHKVTLSYKTQYFVEVRSSYGSVSGSGWYDRGSSAKVAAAGSMTWPISYTLSGWRVDPPTGKLTKSDDSWMLAVDRPYVVEAVWSVDYMPIIGVFGGGALVIAALAASVSFVHKRGMFGRAGPILRPPKPRERPSRSGPTRVCNSCGNRVPEGALFCQRCGESVEEALGVSLEDRVYTYILKHEGVISLSKAAKDLVISVEELKETTEKLKRKGRLA